MKINTTHKLIDMETKNMQHFRVELSTGKKRSVSRVLYVRAETIADAYMVGRKIRDSDLKLVTTISFEDYMKGVDKKYATRTL